MAETFSTQFTNLYVTKPPTKTYRNNSFLRSVDFDYTHIAAGTAADTTVLQRLPPLSRLDLVKSWFYVTGFTATMTLSIGWKAYTDVNGTVQTLNATGLYSASDVSSATCLLTGGMQAQATPDDEIPVVGALLKDFNNATPVDIIATYNVVAPGLSARILGVLYFTNIG